VKNESKTFRIKDRGSTILSLVFCGFFALITLNATIVGFKGYLGGQVVEWQNSWWMSALFFGLFIFLFVDSLRDVFLQLTLSQEGIWYSQLGSKRFIPWEEVKGVGVIGKYLTGKKKYGFILKSEPNESKKTYLDNNQVIPLSKFVGRWLGSELREEIKRLNPLLPIQ
jgi:hypothetical protein